MTYFTVKHQYGLLMRYHECDIVEDLFRVSVLRSFVFWSIMLTLKKIVSVTLVWVQVLGWSFQFNHTGARKHATDSG